MTSTLDEVRLINAQHDIQLRLIKEIRDALHDGQDAGDLVARLRAWNKAHAEAEELLMRRHAYSETDAHAAEHRKITTALDALITSAAADALSTLMRRHIRDWDLHFHAFLEQPETGTE
jgi:hemerythrin